MWPLATGTEKVHRGITQLRQTCVTSTDILALITKYVPKDIARYVAMQHRLAECTHPNREDFLNECEGVRCGKRM